jgi:hypothetical protein
VPVLDRVPGDVDDVDFAIAQGLIERGERDAFARDHYVTASPRVEIGVESIDPVLQRAVVRITRQ